MGREGVEPTTKEPWILIATKLPPQKPGYNSS